jgi:hypothetical protein
MPRLSDALSRGDRRQIRRTVRRTRVASVIDWFMEPGKKHRIITMVLLLIGAMAIAAVPLLLIGLGLHWGFTAGLSCAWTATVVTVDGFIIGAMHEQF